MHIRHSTFILAAHGTDPIIPSRKLKKWGRRLREHYNWDAEVFGDLRAQLNTIDSKLSRLTIEEEETE